MTLDLSNQMKKYKIAIVGLGATGTVLAAALLRKDPGTVLVGRSNDLGKTLVKDGIRVSGEISHVVPVENYCSSIRDLGENYINQAVAYLEEAGVHKDSMCADIENRRPTEIDFLGAKVVAYARAAGISVPFFTTMTNLVKALESNY